MTTEPDRAAIERFLDAIPGTAKWSPIKPDSAAGTTHSVTVEYEHEGYGDVIPRGYRLAALYGLDEAGRWSWRAGWGLPHQSSLPIFAPVRRSSSPAGAVTAHGFLWLVRICRTEPVKVGAMWARAWTKRGARRAVTVPDEWAVATIEKRHP